MAENSGEVIPQPQYELGSEPVEGRESLKEKSLERRPQPVEGKSKQTPQFTPPVAYKQPYTGGTDSTIQVGGSTLSKGATSDLKADDADRIEKQWIDRTKMIVNTTKDDPYKQKVQMSKVKADYIKKRFDKSIPVDDAAIP
jgi:hypothetical protein